MPPQISDDEASDFGSEAEVPEPVSAKVEQEKKGKAKPKAEEPEHVEEESLMVDSGREEEDEDDEDLPEDEYVVEKITNHLIDNDTGELRFEVKWEGFEKKSDRTWEPEDNLLETASKILNEYLASVGGRDEIFAQWEEKKAEDAAKKSKKRSRASTATDTPQANGSAKRGRKSKDHPLDTTPPTSASRAAGFTPPTGNWRKKLKESTRAKALMANQLCILHGRRDKNLNTRLPKYTRDAHRRC